MRQTVVGSGIMIIHDALFECDKIRAEKKIAACKCSNKT